MVGQGGNNYKKNGPPDKHDFISGNHATKKWKQVMKLLIRWARPWPMFCRWFVLSFRTYDSQRKNFPFKIWQWWQWTPSLISLVLIMMCKSQRSPVGHCVILKFFTMFDKTAYDRNSSHYPESSDNKYCDAETTFRQHDGGTHTHQAWYNLCHNVAVTSKKNKMIITFIIKTEQQISTNLHAMTFRLESIK